MMSTYYGNSLANPGGGGVGTPNNNNDPYLTNDFYPLQLASSEILSALRADESAPDADLYRRLISSSGVGAHRYHRVEGGGLGGMSSSSSSSSSSAGDGNKSSNDNNDASSTRSRSNSNNHNPMRMGNNNNVIGSPLGVLRGMANSAAASSNSPSSGDEKQLKNQQALLSSSSSSFQSPPTPYLQHDRSIPLPTQLANEAKHAKLSSLMGLLPEANLVWVTSDDKLFLWSYNSGNDGSWGNNTPKQSFNNNNNNNSNNNNISSSTQNNEDYCSFTVPSGQCIVSVGLVRPKSNVFTTAVEWCIVVTTPEEAILCALAKEEGSSSSSSIDQHQQQQQPQSVDGNFGSTTNNNGGSNGGRGFRHGNSSVLRLIPTRFILPTDSVPLTSICGSKEGRIFMGGVDGCMYEMTYEGNSAYTADTGGGVGSYLGGSDVMERAIDDYFDGRGIFTLSSDSTKNLSEQVVVGGKRVLSALTFGSLDSSDSYGEQRRSKCRKINHSSAAPGLVASVVPGAIVRAASGIFASGSDSAARKGGPIVSMILDEERLCLYTLSSKGVICAYDLSPVPNGISGSNSTAAASSQGDFNSSIAVAPPRLACVFNAVASAKLYLDSVSRGRMYPPSTSQSVDLGIITFPGGNASAQAGVGGMDGARAILKRHDQEMRLVKASSAGSSSKAVQNEMSNSTGILHPVSIHLIPGRESKSLTLVAVTGGGLRYYLSSLASNYINLAQSNQGGFDYSMRGLDPKLARTRPSRKMTFCHIRAPPPYTSGDGNDGFRFELAPSAVNMLGSSLAGGASVGIPPGIHDLQSVRPSKCAGGVGDVVKSFYGNGMFVLALDIDKNNSKSNSGSSRGNSFPTPSSEKGSRKPVGDAIVTVLPDFAARVVDSVTATNSPKNLSLIAAGGISESISLPMTGYEGTKSPVLPGGRTFDISTNNNTQSSLVELFMNSETPSDGELQIGLTPSYIQQKVYQRRSNQSIGTPSSLVVSYDRGSGVFSSALSALSNYIRSGQGYGFEVGTVASDPNGLSPAMSYRVSLRHGCDSIGFSRSSQEVATPTRNGLRGESTPRSTNRSERLPPWMLRPSAAPLNCQAAQHLNPPGTGTTLVLNAGGLHVFNNSSLLNNFASALMRATNVAEDGNIRIFFVSYGYTEGCAMCFALATSSSSDTLRSKARQAAFCYGRSPEMKLTGPSNGDGIDPMSSFTFQPSSLYEGLIKFMSRLLRPFWYKPAVVVTEGRPIQSKSAYANYYARLPAKVELLLDDITLDEIRRPLVLLQELMKSNFDAVKSIPGVSQRASSDQMDVDDGDGSAGLITRAMQNQSRALQLASNASQTQYASDKERKEKAFKTEDRNMHSTYRLLSRSVQVLNLLSCLKQAHSMSTLPDVQWGLLHGLTFYQLVTSQEGQQRIETLLNALVSQGDKTLLNRISQDGDRLAHTLSRQCYLFFSSASRLTYLGFKAANDALSRPTSSPQRGALANKAAAFLRAASRHWYDPALVAGRTNRANNSETWVDLANDAFDAGSPLARAAEVLMELGQVEGLVDMCLICGANFGGIKVPRNDRKELEEEAANAIMDWEKGLYHRPATSPSGDSVDPRSSGTQSIVSGMDITPADALKTCHGILFYYISKLLNDGGPANQRLAESLVAACASSSDAKFLHSMYKHLLSTNQVETALRIDSTSLENWLINEKKDSNLLWRYYSFHGRHFSAGEIMLKKAVDPNEKVPLAQRIECLTRAANSYSSAMQKNLPSSNMMRMIGGYDQRQDRALQERQVSVETLKANIKAIEEKLDIAKIQQRVLTTIDQSQNVDLESDKVDALRFKLVSVSDLYNDYTCPLNLFDVCLLILNTCHYNDRDNIETLWKSVICEEILPCQTTSALAISFLTQLKQGSTLEEETVMQSGDYGNNLQSFDNGEWMPRLRNRVSTLGKELYDKGADYTVPLDLIVQALEGLRQAYSEIHKEKKLSQPWPIETMVNVGVSFDALYQSYDSLYLEVDGTIDATIRLHWLASIHELLKMWVNEAFSNYDSSAINQGSNASSQLAQAVKNGGLVERIKAYNAALEGLVEGNTADIDDVKSGFNEVEEAIRNGF